MSLVLKKPNCVISLEKNLDELKRRSQLESLRYHLGKESCFPPQRDARTSPITMEELKKLARAWKLHERRNFWKSHPTKEDMLRALLDYAEDHNLDLHYYPDGDEDSVTSPRNMMAKVPSESKPSTYGGGRHLQGFGGASIISPGGSKTKKLGILKPPERTAFNTNYFGLQHFNREVQPGEILLNSRFYEKQVVSSSVKVVNIIKDWRDSNFNVQDIMGSETTYSVDNSLSKTNSGRKGNSRRNIRAKIIKQRNLSTHLLNFSSNKDLKVSDMKKLDRPGIEIFLIVGECDDSHTVQKCIMALANICSSDYVRSNILEMNVIHKVTGMLVHLNSPKSLWAASVLFFYLSCEKEIEDRIFNGCFQLLHNNCVHDDVECRMIALYTLNNTLPCIERHRISELIMQTIHNYQMMSLADVVMQQDIFKIILNMSSFLNLQPFLIEFEAMELVGQTAVKVAQRTDFKSGIILIHFLSNFLHSPDLAQSLIAADYIAIFIDLMSISNPVILNYGFRALAVLSRREEYPHSVFDSDILNMLCGIISNEKLPEEAHIDAAKFLTNLCRPEVKAVSKRLLGDGVPLALLTLIGADRDSQVRAIASRGLQNSFAFKETATKLVDEAIDSLLSLLRVQGDRGAAHCLYNLATHKACEVKMIDRKVHLQLLDILCEISSIPAKSSCLQVLAQFSINERCILDLLEENLIPRLAKQVQVTDKSTWFDVSRLLLAIVVKQEKLDPEDRAGIEAILKLIVKKDVSTEQVLIQSAYILSFMTLDIPDFTTIETAFRIILNTSNCEEVVEAAATVLYNVSCSPSNIGLLVKDGYYLNAMIRLVRSAKPEIQIVIAESMRTLCSLEGTPSLLIKNDILSDFIAIALLRTSSEEVKVICSDTFYNILCQEKTRSKLLKGDLWWSMMRLARSEFEPVRKTCARTLYYLSLKEEHSLILRDLQVLSFIRDITGSGEEDYISTCILACHRIVHAFRSPPNHTEITAMLKICQQALLRCSKESTVAAALQMTLLCANSCLPDMGSELDFVRLDIAKVIQDASKIWSQDEECVNAVSVIFVLITQFEAYTKAVWLNELGSIFYTVYTSSDNIEVRENIASVILHYAMNDLGPIQEVVRLSVWEFFLQDALWLSKRQLSSPRLRALIITLYAKVLPCLTESADVYNGGVETVKGILDTNSIPLPPELSSTYVQVCTAISTIIVAFSYDPDFSELLVSAEVFSYLAMRIHELNAALDEIKLSHRRASFDINANDSVLIATEQDFEFLYELIATTFRNIAIHTPRLNELVYCKHLDIVLKQCYLRGIPNQQYDVCFGIFRAVEECDLRLTGVSLTSEFVSEACNWFVENAEPRIIKTANYILGLCLDKFNMQTGADPLQVYSMHIELHNEENNLIPQQLSLTGQKHMADATKFSEVDCRLMIRERSVALSGFDELKSERLWKPILICKQKKIEHMVTGLPKVEPIVVEELELSDPYPMQVFTKILRHYPRICLDENDPDIESGLDELTADDDADADVYEDDKFESSVEDSAELRSESKQQETPAGSENDASARVVDDEGSKITIEDKNARYGEDSENAKEVLDSKNEGRSSPPVSETK